MERQLQSKGLPHYGRILYAMDGSESGQMAGKHAVFLAQRSQAELIVLYIIPRSITPRLSFLLRRVAGEERRMAKQAVDDVVQLAAASGVRAVPTVLSGHRDQVLNRTVTDFDVDLIVMSSSGGGDLQKIFGPPHGGETPLWATRPVCVIMC